MSEFKTNKISPRKGTTQTIGDSGDTLSIASGVTVTNAGTISTAGISGGTINNTSGTISGLQGVIDWDTTPKTTAFTAVSNKGYFCNTTSAAFTVTLPASPVAGDVIALKDYANTFDTNNLTLNPNGNKIQGSTTNFIISVEGANSQFIYVDSTRGWVLTDASKASDISESATFIVATGGTITTCGNCKIHTFTSPGTFCVSSIGNPAGGPNNVDYMVVAGGGGGGNAPDGGGGGAGGYRASGYGPACLQGSAITVTASPYPITVGGGASAGRNNGSNSIFSSITSAGGGGGGSNTGTPPTTVGAAGGSGGGSGAGPGGCALNGGAGNTPPTTPPQGFLGGYGGSSADGTGGGGGGATSRGLFNDINGGPGGNGAPNAISGSANTYAGGGGGDAGSGSHGTGGPGGGGSSPGVSGTTNTGGGGGAGGGGGGSGIVIIRYKYQ